MVTTLALLCIIFPEQNGDKSGEEQTAPYAEEQLIAEPILSAEEQLQTFKLKQPYAIELVASEPLVFDPVIAMWDEQQRLWVVEMTSYMRDADGNNEDQANCCVAVIIDSNDDGKLDQRIEYLNDLILPRGIVPVKEGMLVLAPPNLLLCEDLDGDLVADRRTIIKSGFENAITVPEHAPNNMLRSIDNYIYLAKHNKRWQWKDGQLIEDGYTSASQWGLTEDLYGRKFYNHNSYPLFFDKLPANYFAGKSFDFKRQALQQAIATERPHPARLSFGVNRAYRSDTLDGDGYLQKWTGCCGVFVEGDKVINAFNCEPCGNLIHGSTITIDGQLLESFELLTSTDERFRPVNLFPGPDGAIYVVDMYRGIFQHKVYLTSYLRSYSEKLGLEKPGNNGRIWKIYRTNAEPLATNQLNPAEATQAQLVSMLDHPNKWWRDAAQRLLIDGEQLTTETIALLQQSKSLHATYTLEAIGRLRCQDLVHLLESKDEQRRLVALRLLSDVSDSENIKQLLPIINDLPSSQLTRWQQQLLQDGATTSSTDSKNSSPEAELFMQSCSVCHGTDALGIDKLAPSLIGSPFLNKSDDELSKLIAEGNNIMPPVNGLNADQRQQIINYLRTLYYRP